MTFLQLHENLKDLGIPEDRYYLGGLHGSVSDEGKLALSINNGVEGLQFEIYYTRRNYKRTIKLFNTEEEACEYIYRSLKFTKEFDQNYSRSLRH